MINLSSLIDAGENIIRVPGARLGYHLLRIGVPPGTLISVQYERVIEGVRHDARLRADGIASGVYEFSIDGDLSFLVVTSSADVPANIWLESAEQAAGAFTGDRAMVVQPYDSINIKRGRQFELTLYIELASGEVQYYAAELGSEHVIVKTRSIDANGGFEYTPSTESVYSGGVLEDRVINLNGNSLTENTMLFYSVPAVSVVDEGVDYNLVKGVNDTGVNRNLGQFPEGIELIPERGSKILLKFESTQTQPIWILYKVTWYEGEPDVLPDEPKP